MPRPEMRNSFSGGGSGEEAAVPEHSLPHNFTDKRVRVRSRHSSESSSLLHNRASISIDWCATRGLLSAQSMRRLTKERKKEERGMRKEAKKMKKLMASLTSSSQAQGRSNSLQLNSSRKSELDKSFETSFTKEKAKSELEGDSQSTCDENDDDDEGSIGLEQVGLQNNKVQQDRSQRNNNLQVPDQFENGISSMGTTLSASGGRVRHAKPDTVKQNVQTNVSGAEQLVKTSSPAEDFHQNMRATATLSTSATSQARTQSTLLPADAAQDATWFAKRGLMSRKSLKTFMKEMKESNSVPNPLIEVEGLSHCSSVSGLKPGEEKGSIIDGSSVAADISSDRDDVSLEEGFGTNHVTILVPDKFNQDLSSINFDWKTSSKTLQHHWAKYGGRDDDEDDSSTDCEDNLTPSREGSLSANHLSLSLSQSEGSAPQPTPSQSILRNPTPSTRSSKRVSFGSTTDEMLRYNSIEVEKRVSITSEISGLTQSQSVGEDTQTSEHRNLPPTSKGIGSAENRDALDSASTSDKETVLQSSSLRNPPAETSNVVVAEEEANRTLAQLIQSVLQSKTETRKLGFSPDEVNVLHKMVKRLSDQDSEAESDEPKYETNASHVETPTIQSQNLKGSFNSRATLKTNNTSESQSEMLAKVAREMSACLEQSRSRRANGQDKSNILPPKQDKSSAKPSVLSDGLRPQIPHEQPANQVKEEHPEEAFRTSMDTNHAPESDGAVKDVTTNSKLNLQALIGEKARPSRSSLNSSIICLPPPTMTVPPNVAPRQHEQSEAPTRKMKVKRSRRPAPPSVDSQDDILSLGINIISVTMLVNIYGRLREMSLLGHASVRLKDIDVNSHQRNSRMKELKRLKLLKPEDENKGYLETTLTAGFIVRTAIDECELFESSPYMENGPLSQLKKASMEYDATMVKDFKALVAESLTDNFDGECFEKGSVMRELVDSGLEIVWISDRHPSDINYCICVNRIASKVIVVFRGDEGVLRRVKDSNMMDYDNPLSEVLPDAELIKLRAAASKDILIPRLDTKQSIVEEIHDKVKKIQEELNDRDQCQLCICGHSLGGGFASVAGFYLACTNDLNLAFPIQIVTFASPRVGDKEFQRSFQHLEDSGRILYARFTNMNDMISLRPFWALSGSWKFEDWYKHVGMHICLGTHSVQGFDISYKQVNFITEELWKLTTSYFCGNSKNSSIFKYYHRMRVAKEQFAGQQKRIGKRKRRKLITLEECYALHQSFTEFDGDVKSSTPSSLMKLILVTLLILVEIGLLIRMMLNYFYV